MTSYIDGLFPTTRSIVARFRESQPRRDITFEGLTHFSKGEGEAFPALTQQYNPSRNNFYSTRPS